MTFKVGDRVAMPDGPHLKTYALTKAGWTGTITRRDDNPDYVRVKWDGDAPRSSYDRPAKECHLISEEIYNSPLYKVLK